MAYSQGDVVWAWLPYSNGIGGENRPVLVVSAINRGKDITVAQITGQIRKSRKRRYDYVLRRWSEAGLSYPAAIRPKLFVILKGRVSGRIGRLHDEDRAGMMAMLANLFGI